MASSFVHDNEPSFSIKGEELLVYVKTYYLRKTFSPWSHLVSLLAKPTISSIFAIFIFIRYVAISFRRIRFD
jgi:hypothetical protein